MAPPPKEAEAGAAARQGGTIRTVEVGLLERWYLRYALWSGVYMLDTTETRIANIVFAALFFYFARFLWYLVHSLF